MKKNVQYIFYDTCCQSVFGLISLWKEKEIVRAGMVPQVSSTELIHKIFTLVHHTLCCGACFYFIPDAGTTGKRRVKMISAANEVTAIIAAIGTADCNFPLKSLL